MTEVCKTCHTRWHVEQDEDGGPGPLPGYPCVLRACGRWLCPGCHESYSFACDGCGARYCNEHLVTVPDGSGRPLQLCVTCSQDPAGVCPAEGELVVN